MGRDSIVRMDSGREFQRRGAKRLIALSPIVDKRAEGEGLESREEEEDPESFGRECKAGGAQGGMEEQDYGGS